MNRKPSETQSISVAGDKIIVALDVETAAEAREIIGETAGTVGAYKIGLQLFTSAGASFVSEVCGGGHKVFLDLKFHDIPNTVAKAAVEAARLGVWMFNVHAAGGSEMMRRTISEVGEFCRRTSIAPPLAIAVTVLTSSDDRALSETGVADRAETQVLRLARLADECGFDGVVASPLEIKSLRAAVADGEFVIVTPGIRPFSATNDDQKRVMTPGEAAAAGANYLVIGRPITGASSRAAAIDSIVREIESL